LLGFYLNSTGSQANAVNGTGASLPVAGFAGSPTGGSQPLTVSFTDTSTGTITNRLWDWGDGAKTNTTATNLTHTYNILGTNTVKLTVTGPVGTNILTRTNYITVTNLAPVTLTIQVSPTGTRLTWATGVLQSAGDVRGPFTNLTGISSPYVITPSGATQFFRVKVR
jgi:PKD repeat protein